MKMRLHLSFSVLMIACMYPSNKHGAQHSAAINCHFMSRAKVSPPAKPLVALGNPRSELRDRLPMHVSRFYGISYFSGCLFGAQLNNGIGSTWNMRRVNPSECRLMLRMYRIFGWL